MFHHVARSVPHRLLWCRDTDAARLFHGISGKFPELIALCVMPDHIHLLLPHDDPDNRLHDALSGYAIGLHRRRAIRGPLWAGRPPPERIPDDKHARRTIRYVHLNPCRSNLASDPLAWPFSTHRDRCGYAAKPVVDMFPGVAGFHQYVSGDPAVDVRGTPLPSSPVERVAAARLAEAVASVWRVGVDQIASRHPARSTFVRAAVFLGLAPSEITSATGLSRSQCWRLAAAAPERGSRPADPVLLATVRAAADPRFTALTEEDHRRERAWLRYANCR